MMRKLALVLVCLVGLSGCVLSVDPLVPESETIFDSRMLGEWGLASGSDRVVVSRAGLNSYSIQYTENDGKASAFGGRLGRLGERLVLDVWATPLDSELTETYRDVLITGHSLFSIELSDTEIRTSILDQNNILSALRANALRLDYSIAGDQLILRGTTEQLRSALRAFVTRAGAFADSDVWRKVASSPSVAASPVRPASDPCFTASEWPEADLLFRRDPNWVGSDDAYSIDLGNDRTLWLFGDTWFDHSGRHTRTGAQMIRNSVAIQTGADPSTAKIEFYAGRSKDGRALPFFPGRGDEWFWPGHGVRLGSKLIIFLCRVHGKNSGLGFESTGWNAVMVHNPNDQPSRWRITALDTPSNALGVLVGFAGVLRRGDHVCAFGSANPVKSHPIYAVRWTVKEVRDGNLRAPQWWAGSDVGWVADSSRVARWPIFENGQSELTIHFDELTRKFISIQTVGFGPADVAIRTASEVTGPWTAPAVIHRPAEYSRPNVMIYAAKAHPQLVGADLVLTYATNTFQFSEHLTDSQIYYPRFVRLTRCK